MKYAHVEKNIGHLLQLRFGIIGESDAMKKVNSILLQAAPTDLSVLITGETGTGKEVFANAIHGLSNRKNKSFVSVNCGAIPETLLESELFGHEKGAFTGAYERREGFFEAANHGTIFLDEIGEMPVGTQVKLLRVLESGEFSRIGSPAIKKVDVRVIAATNRNLEENVQSGLFRQDLFFRLNSIRMELPSLREHTEDIPLLVEFFSEKISKKIATEFEGISQDALSILKGLPWPGNVREFRNMLEKIITLEKGEFISAETLRMYIPPALPAHRIIPVPKDRSIVAVPTDDADASMELGLIFKTLLEIKHEIAELKQEVRDVRNSVDELNSLKDNLQQMSVEEELDTIENYDSLAEHKLSDIEKLMVKKALDRFGGNRRQAALNLGISERTLYRKITEYKLF